MSAPTKSVHKRSSRGKPTPVKTPARRPLVSTAISESPGWVKQLLTLAVACLATLVAVGVISSRGEIAGGVATMDVPVGGLSLAEARRRIDDRAQELRGETVTLRLGEVTWTPTLADLGVSYDADRAFGLAAGVGRGRDMLTGVLRSVHLVSSSVEVDAPVVVDLDTLEAYCRERMAELDLAPVDASLDVDGALVSITPDASGLIVSVDALRADLVRELSGFTSASIDLRASLRPAEVQAADLERQLRSMDATFAQPLALYHGADQWLVPPSELAGNLQITLGATGNRLTFDEAAIDALVEQLAGEIDRVAREADVDTGGTYDRLVSARSGRSVDRELLDERIHEALAGGLPEVEVPVVEQAVEDTSAQLRDDLGITTVVASGTSDFSGSDDRRRENIRIAARLLDGTLLGPDETLSFNHAIGEITADEGFLATGVSEGGISGTSVGGGVCQVSTTLFRAALLGGLPIAEWWPHAYRSLAYEQGGWTPGLDALVEQPDGDPMGGADLRVTNPTEGYLLIEAELSEESILTVTLSGGEPTTTTELLDAVYLDIVPAELPALEEIDATLPEGSVSEWQPARDGVTMVVTRLVYDAATGELLAEDEFVSTYAPQGPVYRVSPDQAGAVAGTMAGTFVEPGTA